MKKRRRDEYYPQDIEKAVRDYYNIPEDLEIGFVYDDDHEAGTVLIQVREYQVLDILAELSDAPREKFDMGFEQGRLVAVCEWDEDADIETAEEGPDEDLIKAPHGLAIYDAASRDDPDEPYPTGASIDLSKNQVELAVILDSWRGRNGWLYFIKIGDEYRTADHQQITVRDTSSKESRLPGWHEDHICGFFCDGQDGRGSQCDQEYQGGMPSAWCTRKNSVFRIGDRVCGIQSRDDEDRPVSVIVGFDCDKSPTTQAVIKGVGKIYVTEIEFPREEDL